MPACCKHRTPLVLEPWTQVLTPAFSSCHPVPLVLGCHESSPFPFLPAESSWRVGAVRRGEPCGAEQFLFGRWGLGLPARGSPRAGVVQARLQVPECVSLAPWSMGGASG